MEEPPTADGSAGAIAAPQLWPIFICYRQIDGLPAARRLHELLDKRIEEGPALGAESAFPG